MAKKHKLTAGLSYDYEVIAIVSTLVDFKLCIRINKLLGLDMKRAGDVPFFNQKLNAFQYFPVFRYCDSHHKTNWFLVANRNYLQQRMLTDLKQLDFFLILDELPPFLTIQSIVSRLRGIKGATLVQKIETEASKQIDHFLQDLEMYVLELDQTKQKM